MPSTQKYLLAESLTEVERLSNNHRTIRSGFKRLVLAPVDLSRQNLRIIDSACADGISRCLFEAPQKCLTRAGLWLRDLTDEITSSSFDLVGADLTSSFFPTPAPSHTSFVQQSITEPWPQEMRSQFDLVHQRMALTFCGASKTSIQTSVDYLVQLAKPGGWIQLVEPDHTIKDSDGPMWRQVNRLIGQFVAMLNTDVAFPHTMADVLRNAGCEEVTEQTIDVPLGKPAANDEIREISRSGLFMSIQVMVEVAIAKGFEGWTREQLEQLAPEFDRELADTGDYWRFYVVCGRMPAV